MQLKNLMGLFLEEVPVLLPLLHIWPSSVFIVQLSSFYWKLLIPFSANFPIYFATLQFPHLDFGLCTFIYPVNFSLQNNSNWFNYMLFSGYGWFVCLFLFLELLEEKCVLFGSVLAVVL